MTAEWIDSTTAQQDRGNLGAGFLLVLSGIIGTALAIILILSRPR